MLLSINLTQITDPVLITAFYIIIILMILITTVISLFSLCFWIKKFYEYLNEKN